MMFVVEQDQCRGDDVADAPGAASPAAQRLEARLQQRVGAFAQAAQGAVDGVVGLLIRGELATGEFLDRDAQQVGFAFVAQVGQAELAVVDPGGDLGEQVGSARAAVVSCSRPGRTGEVHSGQPSGAETT